MKRLRKILAFSMFLILVLIQLTCSSAKSINTSLNISTRKVINAAVLLYSFDDIFLSLIQKSLEDVQKANEDKIKFTFFDGKANPAIQYQIIDNLIGSNYDLLILNMVEGRKEVAEEIFLKVRGENLPIVLLASTIPETGTFNTYNKAYKLTGDLKEPGIIQGKLVADTWNANKETMDKNKDNTLQYIMLKGRVNSEYANLRTKYSIKTVKDSGIEIQEFASATADWNKDLANNEISSLFLRYGNKIEAIISNNDAMALGAIEALQQYGYNKGDKSKTIPVFGIDLIPEAKDLIKKGYMTGSVYQDPRAIAEAIYDVGKNLVSDESPIEGTNFEINSKEIIVPLAYKPYTISSD